MISIITKTRAILFRPLALGHVTILLLFIFVMPGIVMGAVYRQTDETSIEGIDKQASQLDLHIAESVRSPFYLSRINPCWPETENLLDFDTERLMFQCPDCEQSNVIEDCRWVYDNFNVIGDSDDVYKDAVVVDEWVYRRSSWFIARRVYSWDQRTVVTDHFNPIDATCFKRRVYEESEEVDDICLPESGLGEIFSPIPPSFYWFFYR